MTQTNKRSTKNQDRQSQIYSPEELGKLIRVTEPRVYLVLVMGMIMAGVVVAWSILGFVPSKVTGSGILIPPGGLMDIVALGSGQLTELSVVSGQRVRQGQVVATLRAPELENQMQRALTELAEAKTWLQKRTDHFDRTLGIQERQNAEQIRYLGFRKKYLTEYFTFLEGHVKNLDKLRKSGSVTGKQLEETRNSMNSIMAAINQCELDKADLKARLIEAKSQADLEIIKAEERVSKVSLDIENLSRNFEILTKVISPYNGQVVELAVERGDFVSPGSPIALLKPMAPLLEAVILFPVQTGKKIKPGMVTYVYPSTANREKYGCIYGLVADVSEYPATVDGFRRLVGNTHMIEAALAQGDQMLWTKVALLRDSDAPSGFKWSSSKGPDKAIDAATLADAEVVIDYTRPIDLVFPKFSDVFRLK